VAALKGRDPAAAKQAMLQHLHNVERGFVHSDSYRGDGQTMTRDPLGAGERPESVL
jgi:hypothetical protein